MRWHLLLCLGVSACTIRPAATFDSGNPDGAVGDAGPADSGNPDGDTVDSGEDAGFICIDDGGSCGLPPHAPYCEILKSPRAFPMVEYLVIEATGEFVADDGNYARAVEDWQQLQTVSFASHQPVVAIELTDPGGYVLWFDDAGFELARDGGYHEWDCLNALFGAKAEVHLHYPFDQANASNSWAYVEFVSRMIKEADVEADYASLPHVVGVEPGGYGCTCDCGTNMDTCLDIDAGVFTFIGNLETGQCDELWFRLTDFADGGRQLEQRDGGVPLDWLRQSPDCVRRLQVLRNFDAGF